MVRSAPFCLLILATIAATAFAQSAPAAGVPWFELGGGAGMAVLIGEGGAVFPTAQARVNVLPEVAAELGTHFSLGGGMGFYDLHARITPKPTQRVSPYFTIGGLGVFEIHSVREFRSTLPTGDVVVYPTHTYRELDKPFAVTGGGGARVQLSKYLSLDAGGEVWLAREGGVALATRVTFMVPIGPRR